MKGFALRRAMQAFKCHQAMLVYIYNFKYVQTLFQSAQLPREKREGEMGKKFERWRKIRLVLESSLMKLDDAILLFNDF